jgi:hypothetical protein
MNPRAVCLLLIVPLLLAAAASQPASTARTWRGSDVVTARTFALRDFTADDGMQAECNHDTLKLGLKKVSYSNLLLNDRVDYTEAGIVRIEIAAISKGSVTLQAVCYDSAGQLLKAVDLMENIDAPGGYECPMKIYRTPLRGAKQISFRIWLDGGEKAHAEVSGVQWGIIK